MWEQLPDAIVQIVVGDEREGVGSGFHLHSENYVVTNAHVVLPYYQADYEIYAQTESGEERELTLLDHSPPQDYDFAIMEVGSNWSEERLQLRPDTESSSRGTTVLFGGHPLGYSELLVHKGTVSGPAKDGFSIDAAVNKGNSGGPVVDPESGDVFGIITLKGAVTPEDLEELHEAWTELYFASKGGGATMIMNGVDQRKLNQLIAHSFDTLNQLIQENSNTGIGRVVSISHVNSALTQQFE